METAYNPDRIRNALYAELSNVGVGVEEPISYQQLANIIKQKSVD